MLLIVRNELTRLALLALVARDCSTPVLGTAATVMEAQFFPYPTPPHVVIVDVPARDHHPAGLDAIAEVRRSFGQARVLALIERHDPTSVTSAIDAGAHGVITRYSDFAQFRSAVHLVAAGSSYRGLDAIPPEPDASAVRDDSVLSPRQTEVLQLVAAGMSNRNVAATLHISIKTVEKCRCDMMRVLGVRNAAELIRVAASKGLVDEVPPQSSSRD